MSVEASVPHELPGNPAARRSWIRRRWLVAACAVAVAAAAVGAILLGKAAVYQPLGYGSTESLDMAFPGLPTGAGIRAVNTFGFLHEDFYIPAQPGVFSLFADIRNNGSRAVTIESVALNQTGPGLFYPIRPAGQVRYSWAGMNGSYITPPLTSRILRDAVLRPGQEFLIGIPVRTSRCWQEGIWTTEPDFYVTYRYLLFTHTVAIPWGSYDDQLSLQEPGGKPGTPGTACLNH